MSSLPVEPYRGTGRGTPQSMTSELTWHNSAKKKGGGGHYENIPMQYTGIFSAVRFEYFIDILL